MSWFHGGKNAACGNPGLTLTVSQRRRNMTLRQLCSAGNLSAFSSCSKAAHPSILLQLGGGLYSGQTVTTEIRTRSARVSA